MCYRRRRLVHVATDTPLTDDAEHADAGQHVGVRDDVHVEGGARGGLDRGSMRCCCSNGSAAGARVVHVQPAAKGADAAVAAGNRGRMMRNNGNGDQNKNNDAEIMKYDSEPSAKRGIKAGEGIIDVGRRKNRGM